MSLWCSTLLPEAETAEWESDQQLLAKVFTAEPKCSVSSQNDRLSALCLGIVCFVSCFCFCRSRRGSVQDNHLENHFDIPEGPGPQAPTWRLRRVERIPPCEGCEVRTARCGPLQASTLFNINVQPCASREEAPRCEGPAGRGGATVSYSTCRPVSTTGNQTSPSLTRADLFFHPPCVTGVKSPHLFASISLVWAP